MTRVTVKQLAEEVRILRQRVLELEKKNKYGHWWEEKRKPKCPCCGAVKTDSGPYNPYNWPYDRVVY